jgi:hypothetical protein
LPQSPAMIPLIRASIRDEYRQQGVPVAIDVSAAITTALIDEGVHQPPAAPEVKRESAVKEVSKSEQKANASAPISKKQVEQVYAEIMNWKLESTDVGAALKDLGHRGELPELPAGKFAALMENLQKRSNK